jgi:uncharacterized membrane protein YcaP (DUF421 family)
MRFANGHDTTRGRDSAQKIAPKRQVQRMHAIGFVMVWVATILAGFGVWNTNIAAILVSAALFLVSWLMQHWVTQHSPEDHSDPEWR